MINLINKEGRNYKTKPRFAERQITNRGLCIWQLNKMLRGSGYKISRLAGGTSHILLIPTGYKKVPLVNPFTGYGHVRLYPRETCIRKWQRVINKLMTQAVTKEWIVDGFIKNVQPYYRTYDNKPDWVAIKERANQLWKEHFKSQEIAA
tara:strand:+ start:367 stop:813 length:447 start_codon:yes stop_codon:yes gene_type:complete